LYTEDEGRRFELSSPCRFNRQVRKGHGGKRVYTKERQLTRISYNLHTNSSTKTTSTSPILKKKKKKNFKGGFCINTQDVCSRVMSFLGIKGLVEGNTKKEIHT